MLVPYPARGHVAPMLAVAAELVARGEPVSVVVGPQFGAAVHAIGARLVTPAVSHVVRSDPRWRLSAAAQRSGQAVKRRAVALATIRACEIELARRRPSIAVIDPHTWWARRLSLPSDTQVAWLWSTVSRWAVGRIPVLINGLPELLTRSRSRGGRVRFVGPLLGAMTTADPGLPWDILCERSVLVVSPGTVFIPSIAQLRKLAQAFADSDWIVVMATGGIASDVLGPLPDNVLAYPWIPQARVLAHAQAFVSHGGMNSLLEAVTCGVPVLFRPQIREQRRTAARAVQLGIGHWLHPWMNVRDQVERLVNDNAVVHRLQSLGEDAMGVRAVAEAADRLLELADA